MSKQPNAVCMFCSENYDPKDFYCITKQQIIHEPQKPRRCARYTGVKVTSDTIAYLENLLRQSEKVS